MNTPQRPLSPHLQIYRPQITSVMSILHRLTGIVLSVGALFVAWWLIAAGTGADSFAVIDGFLASWLGLILLFLWTLAFFYHLLSGVRHLIWDTGYGIEMKFVNQSGKVVWIAAIVLTVIAWIVT